MARWRKTATIDAVATALDVAAPVAERYDASADVTKSALTGGQLIPAADVQQVIDHINDTMWDDVSKSSMQVRYAGDRGRERGMQSVMLDDYQITAQGSYWDRPGLLNFDSMRAMVEGTPILNAIILTRIRQVSRFCRPQKNPADPGYLIEHIDENVELSDDDKNSIKLLQQFVANCGWEADPRRRKIMKRDTFPQFMAKRVRDSLTMDAAPVETEFKKDQSLGLDGIYAVDGGSIRLCTEHGYEGDDEVFALQVIQGNIRTAYTHYDMVYEVRNPRSDVLACGYGYSETEMLIRIVTYLLNTMNFNGSFFDKNSIPRGILQLFGNYDNNDLASFKRLWLAMVRGVQNQHNLPLLTSKDKESKAEFLEIGGQMNEMAFGKWMSFLTSIACAVYGIAPEEVSMESFTVGKAPLAGSDTEVKITSSSDKGLTPLLSHFETEYTDYFIRCFSPQYRLVFKGLNGDDAEKRFEMRKLTATWNEARRGEGQAEIKGEMGDCPLNPTLQSVWMQLRAEKMQEQQADFGQPPDGDPGQPLEGADPNAARAVGPQSDDREGDFGNSKDAAAIPTPPPEVAKALLGLKPIYALDA